MKFEDILREKLTEIIDSMDMEEQYGIYSEYCSKNSYYDYMPYVNDEYTINEFFYGCEPFEILEKFEGWESSWSYFTNGIYGLEEWNGISDLEEVIDYIIGYEDSLDNDDVEELLDLFYEDLDDYIYNIYEDGMTKNETIDKVIESLEYDFEEYFEEIMKQYEKEIYEIIDDCFED